MEITEIRVKLVEDNSERLKAFCSVTFDGMFVVRDVKVIEGPTGPFVAMPSRKLTDRCQRCSAKNHLRARYCGNCGTRLKENRTATRGGRVKLHTDIAHPIHSECRKWLQEAVVEAYRAETQESEKPGYVAPAHVDDYDDFEDVIASLDAGRKPRPERPDLPERPEPVQRPESIERPEPVQRPEPIERPEPAEPPEPVEPQQAAVDHEERTSEEPIDEKPAPPSESSGQRKFGAGILD